MSTPHTQGLLQLFTTYAHPEIRSADDEFVTSMQPTAKARADARRLVAAWNACNDISTEALERMEFPTRESYERMRGERDELREKLTMITNAKPANLAAATQAPSCTPIGYTVSYGGPPMWHEVKPTIADLRKLYATEIDYAPDVKVYAVHAVEVPR